MSHGRTTTTSRKGVLQGTTEGRTRNGRRTGTGRETLRVHYYLEHHKCHNSRRNRTGGFEVHGDDWVKDIEADQNMRSKQIKRQARTLLKDNFPYLGGDGLVKKGSVGIHQVTHFLDYMLDQGDGEGETTATIPQLMISMNKQGETGEGYEIINIKTEQIPDKLFLAVRKRKATTQGTSSESNGTQEGTTAGQTTGANPETHVNVFLSF